ncbi:MAG: carbon-nitrogen hydrolase family protein [Spirosomaceae bacterium]|jgi:predicted amidohydrolase|nr:carbon-nitrogen hydrolase family protein [Spirosomataceae bacterium]
MKIAIPQIRPVKGDIETNLQRHADFVRLAVGHGVSLMFFPELSLTGYEPTLAHALATTKYDKRLEILQNLSNEHQIALGVGLPTRSDEGVRISMVIILPNGTRLLYSKQLLHPDELRYFVAGEQLVLLPYRNQFIAPAICYESLVPTHAATAAMAGTAIYFASVAKSVKGVEKAKAHYPIIAQTHKMMVLMANCVGTCDDFVAAGQSAVWNQQGELIGQLNATEEGILILDTETDQVTQLNINLQNQ